MKKLSGEFSLSFAVTRLKIGGKKITLKLHKTAYPALWDPRGVDLISPNQVATKTYQTPRLQNRNWFCRKKDKIR